ncbi:MAG: preprotein translocase subunit YajC [Planctomycetota bacterium]|nr:preprotein translocase subunit YajC [Planctomycetota bacterium]
MPFYLPSIAGLVLVGQGQAPATPQQLIFQVLPFLLVGVAAWTLLYKPERERLKRQQDLLAALKKNDRVLTSAGIYGTVANVDRESGRVTLKVDDAANVKIQVALSSIASVLDGSTESAASSG